MSIAATTREAIQRHPCLLDAMFLGVVNYTAAARFLDVGDTEAVAAALRRLRENNADSRTEQVEFRIRMERGIGEVTEEDDALFCIGNTRYGKTGGKLTVITANGTLTARRLGTIALRLSYATIEIEALTMNQEALFVLVPSVQAAKSIQCIEDVHILHEHPTDSNELRG